MQSKQTNSTNDRIDNPQIDCPVGMPQFEAEAKVVLTKIFAGYHRVTITQELRGGLTQSQVLVVQPIRIDGKTDLPLVVKIGPVWLIEKELAAYQRYIRDKLSGRIELVNVATTQNWGALSYRLAGDGQFKLESLSQFYHHLDTDVVEEVVTTRLIKRLETMWRDASVSAAPYLGAKYDLLLPVHLIIEPQTPPPHALVQPLTPTYLISDQLKAGEWVRLEGFVITEVDSITQEITLDLPAEAGQQPRSHRVRLQHIDQPDSYQANQILPAVEGIVIQTRLEWLQHEVQKIWEPALNLDLRAETLHWPDGRILPNPLAHLPALLHNWPQVKIAYLHGDLNLENILIDPETGDVTLIDFANAGEDHVLHDLLHLETNIVAQLLSKALIEVGESPDLICSLFYERLHRAATIDSTLFVPPKLLHPALKKPFVILAATRQAAQSYLLTPQDWSEYYRGLALHLLGALKFKNLDKMPSAPLPKQVLFLGAAAAVALWRDPKAQLGVSDLTASQTQLQAELRTILQDCFQVDLNCKTLSTPNLLNPLAHLAELLEPWLEGDLTRIHGQFKLADIWLDPETYLIELGAVGAHRDYILHELLRLELGVVTGLIPPALVETGQPPGTILFLFYERLHRAVTNDLRDFSAPKSLPIPLRRAFECLAAIRQRATHYLLTSEDWSRYYRGLALHFLSTLRLKELDQVPHLSTLKQVTFLAAAVATDLWRKPAERPQPPNPYKGLQAFQEVDAPFFFGRESFVQELVKKVTLKPLVTLTGPSGSGKSSVIFAGLVPQLKQQGNWLIASFRPGSAPFEELARVLTTLFAPLANGVDRVNLAEALKQGEQTLSSLVKSWLNQADQTKRLLLIVDQFEEIYTLCPDPQLRQSFLDTLLAVILEAQTQLVTSTPALHLVLTLRADFMGKVLAYAPFGEMLQATGVELLGAMSRSDLARAIEYPAEKLGFSLAYGLVERVLDDVGTEPGHLPLLEFALDLLWKLQRNGRLTLETYETIGRIRGAVTYYADQIWEDLTPVEQTLVRRIFIQLVHPGAGTEDTRRVATRAELAADWDLVQKLTGTRLVVTNRTAAGMEVVEIVHEALIQNWGRLRLWMETDRNFRAWQERLRVAINQWHTNNQEEDGLLRGAPLAEAEDWLWERQVDLSAIEEDFILRSITLREQIQAQAEVERQQQLEQARALAETQRRRAEEQAQAAAQLRRRAIWLGTALVMLLFAVGAAILFGVSAQSAANRADANLATAQYRATQERQARGEAVTNLATAEYRATLEAAARNDAVANLATAEFRATLEAQARDNAEKAATLESLARAEADTNLATAEYRATLEAFARGQADANLATAQFNATLEAIARTEADANLATAQLRATLEAQAKGTAEAKSTQAFQAQSTAQAEATRSIQAEQTAQAERATAEAERDRADIESRLAVSRQLSAQALNLIESQYDLALLLAVEANRIGNTTEAKDSLLTGLQTYPHLVASLRGHRFHVFSVAISPDGRTIAAGGGDGTLRLWNINDLTQPQPLAPLNGQPVGRSLAFSPDGHILVSGNGDNTIRFWNVSNPSNPQLLARLLTGHVLGVNSVAFSPNGYIVASGGGDNFIRLWNVSNPTSPQLLGSVLTGHTNWVWSLAFSPDGRTLATGGGDNTIRLWDVSDPAHPQSLAAPLTGHNGAVYSVAFSPDGRILASGSEDRTIILWNLSDLTIPQPLGAPLTGHTGAVYTVAFSPDGHILASGGRDDTVRLWNISSPTNPQQLDPPFTGHTGFVRSLAFSPDGATLASGSEDNSVILWNIAGSADYPSLGPPLAGHIGAIQSVALSSDSCTLASGSEDHTIRLWNVSNPSNPQLWGPPLIGHMAAVESVAFSPDNSILASGSEDFTIRLWDVSNPANPQLLGLPLTGHMATVRSVVFSPSGHILASGSDEDSTIRFWDLSDPAHPTPLGPPLTEGLSGVNSLTFNPDGRILASGHGDYSIKLWDVSNPANPQSLGLPLNGHARAVWSVTVSPDGYTLASGSGDSDIRLWDIRDPVNSHLLGSPLTGDKVSSVQSVVFSLAGRILASGSTDKTVKLWDVSNPANPKRLGSAFIGHSSTVNSVAIDPQGRVLASGSQDTTIRLWDIDLESWQARACRLVGRNLTQTEIEQYIPAQFRLKPGEKPICSDLSYPAQQSASPSVELAAALSPTPMATTTPTPTPQILFTPTLTPVQVIRESTYVWPIPLSCGNSRFWANGLSHWPNSAGMHSIHIQLPPDDNMSEMWLLTKGVDNEPPIVDGIPAQLVISSTQSLGVSLWSATITPYEVASNEVILLTPNPNRLNALFLFEKGKPPFDVIALTDIFSTTQSFTYTLDTSVDLGSSANILLPLIGLTYPNNNSQIPPPLTKLTLEFNAHNRQIIANAPNVGNGLFLAQIPIEHEAMLSSMNTNLITLTIKADEFVATLGPRLCPSPFYTNATPLANWPEGKIWPNALYLPIITKE